MTAGGVIPHARANRNFGIPDLAVTRAHPGARVMVPDPILLIEILSPGNETLSWNNVWTYTTIPSVQEILAIQSTRMEAEVLRRGADGGWPMDPEIVDASGVLALASIGFSAQLVDLYRTTDLKPG